MLLPLTLFLRPSRYLLALIVSAHCLAVASLLVADIPALLATGLGGLVLVSLAYSLRDLLGQRRHVRLTLQRDGTLAYTLKNGESANVWVEPGSTLMPWCLVLLMRDDRQRLTTLTLFPDALSAEDFRQLRLWLRWQVVSPVEGNRQ